MDFRRQLALIRHEAWLFVLSARWQAVSPKASQRLSMTYARVTDALLVIDVGRTGRAAIRQAKEALDRVGGRLHEGGDFYRASGPDRPAPKSQTQP